MGRAGAPSIDDATTWRKRASDGVTEVDATETTALLSPDNESGSTGGLGKKADRWDGLDDFVDTPWWRKPSVYWLLVPYFIFTLAFGGALVPKLNLILSFICKEHFNQSDSDPPALPVFIGGENPQCKIPEVQSKVATFTLIMNFLTGLLSAIVVPIFGSLSDRYGRTRLMALASCGGVLAEIITLLAAKYPDVINYRWLILGSVFDGMTGSFTAGSLLTQSYTSDCTPPSKRAVSIGYLHACLFTGLAFGPLLAGYFVKWTGSLLSVFYVIVACHILFIFFVGLVIPESLSKRRRLAAQEAWAKGWQDRTKSFAPWVSRVKGANPLAPLRILWPTGPGTSTRLRLNLVSLAVSDMIILGSSVAVGPVIILYSEYRFGWGTLEASIFVSAVSLTRTVILLIIFPAVNYFGRVRPAQRRRALGIVSHETNSGADSLDVWVIRVATAGEVLACIGYSLAQDGHAFFISGMVAAMGGLGSASIQAAITKHVPSDKVGQVLGAIGMLHALSRVIGPLAFQGLYAATVRTLPQAFLMVLGSLFCVAFLGALLLKPHVHWATQSEEEEETEQLTPNEEILGANSRHTLPIDEDQVNMQ
ncbi:unnamed protein product [Clonostachys rosea]|uniref:Major facilitator superfamily (MFS) profile domain-containing protein n=1 Tax=Bionectria ochroleuca TaxID=29856 RepID=A0ABY6TWM6_BIOOC|nr:unnamed protein product [Clonostachys rosea]